jgi:hypothetical protein
MPDSPNFEPPDPIERPLCAACGWTMWIASIEPHPQGHEKHTLKCTRCEAEETRIVKL